MKLYICFVLHALALHQIKKCSGFFGFCLLVWKPDKLNIIWMGFVNNKTIVNLSPLVALLILALWDAQVLSMMNILMLNAVL